MAILIAGLLLLSIIIYLLLAPVALSIEIPGDNSAGRNIRMAVFPFSFTLSGKPGGAARKKKPAKEKQERERARKKKSHLSAARLFRMLIDEIDMFFELPPAALRLILGLVKSIRHLNLRVSLRGDFGEPDISGMIYGWSMALTPLLGDSASFFYRPNFAGEPLRAGVFGGFEFRIAVVLKELLIFIWRLPKLRMLKIYWRLKKGAWHAK